MSKTSIDAVIGLIVFFLFLIGICGISEWLIWTFLSNNPILAVSIIALTWGFIVLLMNLIFKHFKWDWWN